MNLSVPTRGLLATLVCLTGLSAVTSARPLYDNTGNPANTYYAGQGGAEAIDDLHLSGAGTLDSLVFEYYEPTPGRTFSATVNVYDNPGGLDLGTAPLAGPFTVAALPSGRKAVTILLPHVTTPGSSIWVGVKFTSTTAGVILHDVPTVGSSHDLYLENGGFYWFGGNPKANFGIRLAGTPTALAVEGATAPVHATLAAPRPNPFRLGTTLDFALDRRASVRLEVLDLSGRRVRLLVDELREPGRYTERWSGRDDDGHALGAGVYFVRLAAGQMSSIQRVVLLR